jgi:anti-anti-sigma factor
MATRRGTWRPSVRVEHADGVVVLEVTGRLGQAGAAAQSLCAGLTQGLEATRGLVVDLSGVDYVSSPGLRLLEDLVTRAGAIGCPLVFCGVTEAARIAVDLADLTAKLPCVATRAEAVAVHGGADRVPADGRDRSS